MLLPDWEIREYCKDLNMISPFSEGVSKPGEISYGLQPAGYDLRLGDHFKQLATIPTACHPTARPVSNIQYRNYWILEVGESVLAETLEEVHLPSNIAAELQGKSSWARLFVHLNTTVVDPGFKGKLTLEITNLGNNPVELRAGDGIAQMWFHKMTSSCEQDYQSKGGKYYGAKGVEASKC